MSDLDTRLSRLEARDRAQREQEVATWYRDVMGCGWDEAVAAAQGILDDCAAIDGLSTAAAVDLLSRQHHLDPAELRAEAEALADREDPRPGRL
jgi:hypothetical protein